MTHAMLSRSRWFGIIAKEFIQLKRDRLTFGMIIGIPVLQLLLFGFAINTDPKHLPTAVLAADTGPFARTFVAALENTGYFRVVSRPATEAVLVPARWLERLVESGRLVVPLDRCQTAWLSESHTAVGLAPAVAEP